MSAPSEAESVPQAWLDIAEEDGAVASRELRARDGSARQVCVSAQQATEKAIKSVLCHVGTRVPHTHDLRYLLSLLPRKSLQA